MALRRRVTAACVLFALGAIAAVPFYRPDHGSTDSRERRPPAPESKTAATVVLQIPSNSEQSVEDIASRGDSRGEANDSARPASHPQSSEPDRNLSKPPQISSNFPGVSEPVPPVSARPRQDASRTAAQVDPAATHDQDGDRPSHHRIRDGDTLRSIARKYLGNSDRWREILEINQQVLKDPEVLPVGKDIRIPERALASSGPNNQVPSATDGRNEQPLTPLVPIQ